MIFKMFESEWMDGWGGGAYIYSPRFGLACHLGKFQRTASEQTRRDGSWTLDVGTSTEVSRDHVQRVDVHP